jgi:hypothetical protein
VNLVTGVHGRMIRLNPRGEKMSSREPIAAALAVLAAALAVAALAAERLTSDRQRLRLIRELIEAASAA